MKTFILRILLSAFCLTTALVVGAQTPAKPLIQTSAAPEETAVWKPSGKLTVKPVADKQKNTPVKQSSGKKSAGKNSVVKKAKKTVVPATGNRYHALKTNVAFDAIGVLNLAYEVQLHRKMTLDLPVMWSLWDAQREHALRVIALQLELRWWTGSEVGRGHFFGLHAHTAWFNFKWEDNRYQDVGRPLLGAGLSYGYKLSLGQHWGAEFNVGVGYANLKYNTYYNIENGALINTRIRHYWGLTRLGLSLVYRL